MEPTFFIAGAPKAGTTSFYHQMDQHPQIYMSPIKEPCYFASELRIENFNEELRPRLRRESESLREYLRGPMTLKRFGGPVAEWEDYLLLFRNVRKEVAIGEASVSYLWSQTAAKNIAARIPDAKIILILRDPVDRAFSQYLQAVSSGLVHSSFREEIIANMNSRSGKFGVLNPFLEFGNYGAQVQRFLDVFSQDNVLIHIYEEMRTNPPDAMAETFRFLGVSAEFASASSARFMEPRVPRLMSAGYRLKKRGIWQSASRLIPERMRPALRRVIHRPRGSLMVDPKDRAYLRSHYREDILKLEQLLNRDLHFWLK
ncbi:MAG TPA: sulfotransferase domain-containing protein [Bryobacteraceae bacterium]|jgi:hypothetical protein